MRCFYDLKNKRLLVTVGKRVIFFIESVDPDSDFKSLAKSGLAELINNM